MSPDETTPTQASKPPRRMVHRDRENPRTVKLVIRLRPAEEASLKVYADVHGLTLTELCRHRLLGWQIPRPPRHRNDSKLYGVLSQIAVALRNAGNNLNQLTKAHHLGFRVEQKELMHSIQQVQAQVDALRLQIDGVGEGLARAPKGPWNGSWLDGYMFANQERKPHGS